MRLPQSFGVVMTALHVERERLRDDYRHGRVTLTEMRERANAINVRGMCAMAAHRDVEIFMQGLEARYTANPFVCEYHATADELRRRGIAVVEPEPPKPLIELVR